MLLLMLVWAVLLLLPLPFIDAVIQIQAFVVVAVAAVVVVLLLLFVLVLVVSVCFSRWLHIMLLLAGVCECCSNQLMVVTIVADTCVQHWSVSNYQPVNPSKMLSLQITRDLLLKQDLATMPQQKRIHDNDGNNNSSSSNNNSNNNNRRYHDAKQNRVIDNRQKSCLATMLLVVFGLK